jgi:hypothetical protein
MDESFSSVIFLYGMALVAAVGKGAAASSAMMATRGQDPDRSEP